MSVFSGSLLAFAVNKKPRKSEAFKFAPGGIRGMFDFLYSKDKKNNPFHYTAFPLWFIPVPVHQFNLFIFLLHFLLHFRELLDGSGQRYWRQMSVYFGGFYRTVSQKFANGIQIYSILYQVAGKCVP